ncbi:transmembrane protein, putative [Medicago truncatula]|nr:transmembrane protein, putative [Medicago truncatula]
MVSLPFVFFCLVLGFGFYFFGSARGRRGVYTNPQVYGMPIPPRGTAIANSTFP